MKKRSTAITKRNSIIKENIKEWALKNGFKLDRYGNMKKKIKGDQELRLKFQSISVRYEIRDSESPNWFLRSSAYLKDVKFNENGTMTIGNRNLVAVL